MLDVQPGPSGGAVRIPVRLTNRGETTWLPGPRAVGAVRMVLFRGRRQQPTNRMGRLMRRVGRLLGRHPEEFVPAAPACWLPQRLPPGESIRLDAVFFPPAGGWTGEWRLDLVNENVAWFGLDVLVPIPA